MGAQPIQSSARGGHHHRPKTTKNANTDTASSSTCSACVDDQHEQQVGLLQAVHRVCSTSRCSATVAVGEPTAIRPPAGCPGRPAQARRHRPRRPTWSSSSGSRASRNPGRWRRTAAPSPTARRRRGSRATCHTSALMNRNVMNSSSSGSARVTIGKQQAQAAHRARHRPFRDRPCAQPRTGVDVNATSAIRVTIVAGPRLSSPITQDNATPAPAPRRRSGDRHGACAVQRVVRAPRAPRERTRGGRGG